MTLSSRIKHPASTQTLIDAWRPVFAVLDVSTVLVRNGEIVGATSIAAEHLGFDLSTELPRFLDSFSSSDQARIQRRLAQLALDDTVDLDVALANGYQTCELRIRRIEHDTNAGSSTDVIVIHDTTSDQAAQLTVLYSASRHRAVLEGLREGVVIFDNQGNVGEANRGAAMIFARLNDRKLVGSNHLDLFAAAMLAGRVVAPDELPTSKALQQGLATADVVLRLDGVCGPRWLSFSCQPIDSMTGPQGAALSVQDVTAHTLAENDLAYLAHHDSLTGLFNRSRLRIEMQLALTQRRPVDEVAVLVLDLDGFKDVNDSHGHGAGDQVLVVVADRLRSNCRQSDRVTRLGGDEFAVLLGAESKDADECAARLIAAIGAPIQLGETSVSVGASVGIATTPASDADIEHLLLCADTAMYASKRSGKGMSTHFHEGMLDRIIRRAELRSMIEAAVVNSDFTLVFQPKVRLRNREIVGFEALLRWTAPTGEVMSPADFVPIAEETGQIVPIGRWVLEQSVAQLVEWQCSHNRPDLTMAVNVSARQLTDSTFVDDLARVIAATGVDPITLTLELTETMLIADPRIVADALARLREQGVLIAIDDYGSGNASISYLRNFAVDVLKVDRSLVLAIDEDPIAGQAVVRSITELAASLNLTTVAEGIEREDQLDVLRALGCDEGQGFHLAMPLTVADVETYLRADADAGIAALLG
jgi:diguanylate cyclase (GGDEF)-like protein